jgi:hypothetical protein
LHQSQKEIRKQTAIYYPAVRKEAKKKKPAITSAIINKIKHGIAPWRGVAEVLLSVVFFLIFGAAIQKNDVSQHGF